MPDTSEILSKYRTIAVVGLSNNPVRASHGVSEYMKGQGYRIIPVNPGHAQILGEKSYRTLEEIPEPVEIVNIFRRSEMIPPVVDSAIAIGAKVVWMQEGIENEDAAGKARAAGLEVVMDTCILKAHRRMR
jgi:predicted CoA-binding protein